MKPDMKSIVDFFDKYGELDDIANVLDTGAILYKINGEEGCGSNKFHRLLNVHLGGIYQLKNIRNETK